MSQHAITLCDRCGAKDIQSPLHVVANAPIRNDGPGVKDEPSVAIDLCATCCKKELNQFLGALSPPVLMAWVGRVKHNRYPKNEEVE